MNPLEHVYSTPWSSEAREFRPIKRAGRTKKDFSLSLRCSARLDNHGQVGRTLRFGRNEKLFRFVSGPSYGSSEMSSFLEPSFLASFLNLAIILYLIHLSGRRLEMIIPKRVFSLSAEPHCSKVITNMRRLERLES